MERKNGISVQSGLMIKWVDGHPVSEAVRIRKADGADRNFWVVRSVAKPRTHYSDAIATRLQALAVLKIWED